MANDASEAVIQVDKSKRNPLGIYDGLSNLATGLGGSKDKAMLLYL